MKKYISFLLAISIVVIFNSCRDESLYPAPDPEWAPVATVTWTEIDKTFYNITDIETAEFEFLLDGEDFGYEEAEVASIDVYIQMNGGGEQFFGTFDNLPTTVTVPSSMAADMYGLTADDLVVGDNFTFSFVVNAVDGRVFDLYNNNICNLIRIEGICHLEAYVLAPSIALTSVDAANSSLSVSAITDSGDDLYSFDLNKKDFVDAGLSSIDIELAYTDENGMTDFMMLESVPASAVPSDIEITATEAADLFGMTAEELSPGDAFTVKFTFNTSGTSFTTYGSAICGADFPSTIVYPFHDDIIGTFPDLWYENYANDATAPPATTMSGSCSMTIPVVD